MVERELGFHFFLDLCPSDTADTSIVNGSGYEGVGAGRIASADGAHATGGLIQPGTRNTTANGRKAVGLTNKIPVDQAHVVAASGTYHSAPTKRISQRTVTYTYSNPHSAAHEHPQ